MFLLLSLFFAGLLMVVSAMRVPHGEVGKWGCILLSLSVRLFLAAVWFWVSRRSPYLFPLIFLHLFSALFPPGLPCFMLHFVYICFCCFVFIIWYFSFSYSLKNVFKQINFCGYVTGQRYLCWKFIQLDPSRKREYRLRNCFYEQSAYWYLGMFYW